jgi:hypothetical protein
MGAEHKKGKTATGWAGGGSAKPVQARVLSRVRIQDE